MGKSQLINQYSFNLDVAKMSSHLQNLWEKKRSLYYLFFNQIFCLCESTSNLKISYMNSNHFMSVTNSLTL